MDNNVKISRNNTGGTKFAKVMNHLAKAKWFDFIGIIIIIGCAIASGYAGEMLSAIHPEFGDWAKVIPFGAISIISAILSLYSDRLTARLNNWGNVIGLFGVVLSGTIDYLLGNQASWLTYPITFVIQAIAIKVWMNSDQYKAKAPLTGMKGVFTSSAILVIALTFSYYVNGIGFSQHNWLFYATTLVFALSLAANVLNAMKLTLQWKYWAGYNVIQLGKALIQHNYANVGKYAYYIIVSIAGLSFWHNQK